MSSLRLTTTKYLAITATNLQNQLAYIWDAMNRVIFIILIMYVFIQLWTAAFAARGEVSIGGLTLANTIWYFLIAEVMELSKFRHDIKISEEVKDGSIAYTLNRPYNYLAYHFFNGLGESMVKMVMIFLVGAPLVYYYAGWPTLSVVHILPLLLVVLLAVLIDFCVLSTIGLMAFVMEDTFSLRLVYQKLVFILGGLLIPIDFLPGWLQTIARQLPFSLTTYAPAKMFVAFDWGEWSGIVLRQFIWLGLLGGLLYYLYRWAARRLVINGG